MKITEIQEDKLIFDDGTTIEAYHDQDCCEHVYADFSQLKDTNITDRDFKLIDIRGVPDSGFVLNGYFVPCYNYQNGYYSGDLSLIITRPDGTKQEKDISEFVESDDD